MIEAQYGRTEQYAAASLLWRQAQAILRGSQHRPAALERVRCETQYLRMLENGLARLLLREHAAHATMLRRQRQGNPLALQRGRVFRQQRWVRLDRLRSRKHAALHWLEPKRRLQPVRRRLGRVVRKALNTRRCSGQQRYHVIRCLEPAAAHKVCHRALVWLRLAVRRCLTTLTHVWGSLSPALPRLGLRCLVVSRLARPAAPARLRGPRLGLPSGGSRQRGARSACSPRGRPSRRSARRGCPRAAGCSADTHSRSRNPPRAVPA